MEKLQSHCANMTFADKSRYDRTFQQVTRKGGEPAINYIKIFQNAQALSVSVGNSYGFVPAPDGIIYLVDINGTHY